MNLAVGQIATRSLTLTAVHVKTFAQLTGDYYPLHFDDAFASKTRSECISMTAALYTMFSNPLGSLFTSE